MVRNFLALASILALASACAGPSATAGGTAPLKEQPAAAQAGTAQAPAKATLAEDQKPICTTERPVGSNIPRRVCRTPEQIEREREAAQEKMRGLSQATQKDFN